MTSKLPRQKLNILRLAMVDLAVLGAEFASPPSHFVDDLIHQGKLEHVLPEWLVETIPV